MMNHRETREKKAPRGMAPLEPVCQISRFSTCECAETWDHSHSACCPWTESTALLADQRNDNLHRQHGKSEQQHGRLPAG